MAKKNKKKNSVFRLSYILVALGLVLVYNVFFPNLKTDKTACANSISCQKPIRLEVEQNAIGIFNNRKVVAPNISYSESNRVLGTNISRVDKHIYVDLATQTLTAYEGKELFLKTPISSGLWGKTPKGDFTIWSKFVATRMAGGSGADYYDLPNVPYVMFFSNDEVPGSAGFSLHGAYWHNNFGHAMSHGCVNMRPIDAAQIFDWASATTDGTPGTKITIYGDLQ